MERNARKIAPVHLYRSSMCLGSNKLGAVYRVESVYVLVGVDGGGNGVFDDTRGERKLTHKVRWFG